MFIGVRKCKLFVDAVTLTTPYTNGVRCSERKKQALGYTFSKDLNQAEV
jgi:hypothetical protein